MTPKPGASALSAVGMASLAPLARESALPDYPSALHNIKADPGRDIL